MTLHQMPTPDFDTLLRSHESKSLLRVIACGSVDDGKSTLIGRLLHESDAVFDDQLAAVKAASRRHGAAGQHLDLAMLLDGLAAEREQGITIDVAYRHFTTRRRKFILADTPGHEQYTRNMATGASTADLAILLIDARKGVTMQTRRHGLILSLLGMKQVIVAVNKMDLIGWSEDGFHRIEAQVRAFAAALSLTNLSIIPLSALTGDNVVARAICCPWYSGPTLLGALEAAERSTKPLPFRMAVQWVNRAQREFRGYCGLVSSGTVAVNDTIAIQPSGGRARVARILGAAGEQMSAIAGQSVTLVLADHVDVARGDLLTAPAAPAQVGRAINATLLWMGEGPAREGASYLVKIGTRVVTATLTSVSSRIDLDTLTEVPAEHLDLNDIGEARIVVDEAIAHDPYRRDPSTGGFILIDRETLDTVGMGLVREAWTDDGGACPQQPEKRVRRWFAGASESSLRSLVKAVTWRLCGSLDTSVLVFLFTGSLKLSTAIGMTEVLTKTALYYAHERLWTRMPFGRSPG